jgi:hypothetical protein
MAATSAPLSLAETDAAAPLAAAPPPAVTASADALTLTLTLTAADATATAPSLSPPPWRAPSRGAGSGRHGLQEQRAASKCALLLLALLFLLAPSQLLPSAPELREQADRSAPSPAQLAVWLRSSVVTRWGGLLLASAYFTTPCPFTPGPGTTGCTTTGGPGPFCDPNDWSGQTNTSSVDRLVDNE